MGSPLRRNPPLIPCSSRQSKCPVKLAPWDVMWSWEQLIYDDGTRRTPTQNANHDPRSFVYGTKWLLQFHKWKRWTVKRLNVDVLSLFEHCQFSLIFPNKDSVNEQLLTPLSSHSVTPAFFFLTSSIAEWVLALECHVNPEDEIAWGWQQKKVWQINYDCKQHSPDSGCFPALTDSKQCSERQLRIALRGYQGGSCGRLRLFVRAREGEWARRRRGRNAFVFMQIHLVSS